jgi:hypothetical protein
LRIEPLIGGFVRKGEAVEKIPKGICFAGQSPDVLDNNNGITRKYL